MHRRKSEGSTERQMIVGSAKPFSEQRLERLLERAKKNAMLPECSQKRRKT